MGVETTKRLSAGLRYQAATHYASRQEAGRHLAEALERLRDKDVAILALTRGGVVLGAEVARFLNAPLKLVLVRKISHPAYPEYAVGAVAGGGDPVYDETMTATLDEGWRKSAEADARKLIQFRRELYYGGIYKTPKIAGKTVVLVDDGMATGLSMLAAVQATRRKHPHRIIVAVPVASPDSVAKIRAVADEVLVLDEPRDFSGAVGAHYDYFPQVSDYAVKLLLEEADHGV